VILQITAHFKEIHPLSLGSASGSSFRGVSPVSLFNFMLDRAERRWDTWPTLIEEGQQSC